MIRPKPTKFLVHLPNTKTQNKNRDLVVFEKRGCFLTIFPTAGWAFGFLRAKGFSSSQFLRYEPETSGIDVTLLGVYNDIRRKSNSHGIMPN